MTQIMNSRRKRNRLRTAAEKWNRHKKATKKEQTKKKRETYKSFNMFAF